MSDTTQLAAIRARLAADERRLKRLQDLNQAGSLTPFTRSVDDRRWLLLEIEKLTALASPSVSLPGEPETKK